MEFWSRCAYLDFYSWNDTCGAARKSLSMSLSIEIDLSGEGYYVYGEWRHFLCLSASLYTGMCEMPAKRVHGGCESIGVGGCLAVKKDGPACE